MARVLVVGAGVIGLTCAATLLAEGHRVDVVARELPRETTSAVAAAIWYPYRAHPQERVLGWAQEAYRVFASIAAEEPDSGVVMRPGTDLVVERGESPWWASAVPDLAETLDVPPGYAAGWSCTVPVIETPVYLVWLRSRVEQLGGTVTRLNLSALPAADPAAGGPDVVVDCSGLGAKHLAADPSMHPVQGQIVLVEQFGLDRWCQTDADPDGPTYVVPRSRDIVVGGTAVEDAWSRTPSPQTAAAVLRRALRIVPELAGAEVVGHKVGLRPGRPQVRLEVERPGGAGAGGALVHCYGHGGAGVTLSWGCAREVADLVRDTSGSWAERG